MLIITKKVKCKPEFSIFTVFLKNRNIILKIKISTVTDYAALKCKINDNNAGSMLCFISLKSIDDENMCKTKYLVYFIVIRSSVSKVLEENLIIYPFPM